MKAYTFKKTSHKHALKKVLSFREGTAIIN